MLQGFGFFKGLLICANDSNLKALPMLSGANSISWMSRAGVILDLRVKVLNAFKH